MWVNFNILKHIAIYIAIAGLSLFIMPAEYVWIPLIAHAVLLLLIHFKVKLLPLIPIILLVVLSGHLLGYKIYGTPAVTENRPLLEKAYTLKRLEFPNILIATDGSRHKIDGIEFKPEALLLIGEGLHKAFDHLGEPLHFYHSEKEPKTYEGELRSPYWASGSSFLPGKRPAYSKTSLKVILSQAHFPKSSEPIILSESKYRQIQHLRKMKATQHFYDAAFTKGQVSAQKSNVVGRLDEDKGNIRNSNWCIVKDPYAKKYREYSGWRAGFFSYCLSVQKRFIPKYTKKAHQIKKQKTQKNYDDGIAKGLKDAEKSNLEGKLDELYLKTVKNKWDKAYGPYTADYREWSGYQEAVFSYYIKIQRKLKDPLISNKRIQDAIIIRLQRTYFHEDIKNKIQ